MSGAHEILHNQAIRRTILEKAPGSELRVTATPPNLRAYETPGENPWWDPGRVAILSQNHVVHLLVALGYIFALGCNGTQAPQSRTSPMTSEHASTDGSKPATAPAPRGQNTSVPSDAGTTGDIDIFLEAARTDIKAPYAVLLSSEKKSFELTEQEERSESLYAEAASRLLGETVPNQRAGTTVALVLSRISDPRGPQALAEWAMRPTTDPWHFTYALEAIRERPRAEYLQVVKAILADNGYAGAYSGVIDLGLYSKALGLRAEASTWALALSIAAKIANDDARSFLREVAMDRNRSAPHTELREAFTCCCCSYGKCNEDEARALSSIRIVALSLLNDKGLASAIAHDSSEPAFIRKWARTLAQGEGPKARARLKRQEEGPIWWVSPCRPSAAGP